MKKLNISWNNIGYAGVVALGSLLGSMNTLKELYMSSIARSRQGWVSFFNALQDSNLNDLVWWSLDNNSIDDEALQLLVGLVSNMSSLKNLNLSATQSATPGSYYQ